MGEWVLWTEEAPSQVLELPVCYDGRFCPVPRTTLKLGASGTKHWAVINLVLIRYCKIHFLFPLNSEQVIGIIVVHSLMYV